MSWEIYFVWQRTLDRRPGMGVKSRKDSYGEKYGTCDKET